MHEKREVIDRRTLNVTAAVDGSSDQIHAEANLLDRPREEQVVFEAPAAPFAHDEFLEDGVRLERRDQAELHVNVLEGNREKVRAMEIVQRLARRCERPAIFDASKVAMQFERHEDP